MRPILLSISLLLLSPFGANATDDIELQRALLRRHTTAEAERRYEAYKSNPDAAVDALNSGLSNLANRMYQRGMAEARESARIEDRRFHYNHVIDFRQPIDINSREDAQILLDVLWKKSDTNNEWFATKLLVEYALWIAPDAERVFPEPDPALAAAILRDKVFNPNPKNRQSWAANQLAKLYLMGDGVPRDELAAFQLLSRCAESSPAGALYGHTTRTEDPSIAETRCLLNLANMYEYGWGIDADAKKAEALREEARQRFTAGTKGPDGKPIDQTLKEVVRNAKP